MVFFVVVFTFLLRALPRFVLRNVYVSDTYFHLYCADVIRKNRFAIPDKLPRVLLPHRFTYPYLYHLLLALFPLRQRLWAERFSSAVFDTLSLIVIYLFSSWIMRLDGQTSSNLPLVVSALFAFSPALLRIGSGPRAYNGSPRPLGLLLYLTHLSCAWVGFQSHNLWLLLGSLIAGACILFGAKFATQALLFFGLLFCVFVTPYYALLLAGCFILAAFLTWGRVFKVLKGHFLHSLNYYQTMQKIFLYPSFGNYSLQAYFEKWKTIKTLFSPRTQFFARKRFAKDFIYWFYTESIPVHLFLTVFPQYLFFFYYIFLYPSLEQFERFSFIWMAAGLFWFILTKIKPFLFLGEGERYLEFALLPSLFLLVDVFYDMPLVLGGVLLYSVVSSIYYVWLYHSYYKKYNEPGYYERKELINSLVEDDRGAILPIGSFHWFSLLFSENPVVTHGANLRPDEKPVYIKVFGRNPYPSENYREIMEQYDVKYIVSDEFGIRKYREEIVADPQDFDSLIEWVYTSPLFWIGKVKML